MVRRVVFCVVLATFLLATRVDAQFGIDTRVSNTSLLIDEVPANFIGSMELQSAFPELDGRFASPMGVFEAPDGSGRLFVLQLFGEILVFPKAAPTLGNLSSFIDLSDRVVTGDENGLLGFAFHPNYATNGEVYIYYTRGGPTTSVIARYTNDDPADNTLSSATEEIILELVQPAGNHNGGTIGFGPDGMLYIAFGDGGGSDMNRVNAQDTTSLFGSVLRIDVDSAPANPGVQNYVIPADNPFVGGKGSVGAREEIYAYGFRNPFRFSFDAMNGHLFLGDVGESGREEINVVVSGGNYGWPIMEGSTCFNQFDEGNPLANCDQMGLTLPIDERLYNSEAVSVLGGYVYYGTDVPELFGVYIYADFITGNIWGLRYDGAEVTEQFVLAFQPGLTLFSLGQDADGEVYLCNANTDGLSVLRPSAPPPPSSFPTQLSDIPALLAAGLGQDQTDAGIIPYAPESRLWSDGALKERFFAIPGLDRIGYTAAGGWEFPEGTVLIKNFTLPLDFRDPENTGQRIETRLLVRNSDRWHGFAYEWNESETDATLLETSKDRDFNLIAIDGSPLNYSWHYPSRSECFQCHTNESNVVLGLNTAQMNHDFAFPASGVTDNQLRTYDHIGLFTTALPDAPADLPTSPDAFAPDASLHDRAMSYLQANCSMCHQPGGTAPTSIDLRWGVALDQRNLVDAIPESGELNIVDPRIISPDDPPRSVLLARMLDQGSNRMPPLGTSLIDEDGVALLTEWVNAGAPGPANVTPDPPGGCGASAGSSSRNLAGDALLVMLVALMLVGLPSLGRVRGKRAK